MKILLFIFIFNYLQAQSIVERYRAIPQEKRDNIDLTFDWWSRAALSLGTAEILYHYTDRRFLSAMAGLAVSIGTAFAERGLYGKCVATGGAIGGDMAFGVRWNIKDKNYQDYYGKRKSKQSLKEQFNNL